MNRNKITACIMTLNEEQNIRRCLESVTWCDEILVLDSFSTDTTVNICKEFTLKVVQEKWRGYISARNRVRNLASHDWVLLLDADEEVSTALRDQILHQFRNGHGRYVAYQFPRQVFYLGRWIKHGEWNPDIKLRLFNRNRGHSGGQEPHDTVIVDGPVKTLRGKLFHYTYDNLEDHLQTMNRFSTISAYEMRKKGRPFRWTDLFFRPAFRFFKGYFIKLGILDGRRGFIIAMISSFGVAIKYIKLWECWLQNTCEAETQSNDG